MSQTVSNPNSSSKQLKAFSMGKKRPTLQDCPSAWTPHLETLEKFGLTTQPELNWTPFGLLFVKFSLRTFIDIRQEFELGQPPVEKSMQVWKGDRTGFQTKSPNSSLLSDYESGKTDPPPEFVVQLALYFDDRLQRCSSPSEAAEILHVVSKADKYGVASPESQLAMYADLAYSPVLAAWLLPVVHYLAERPKDTSGNLHSVAYRDVWEVATTVATEERRDIQRAAVAALAAAELGILYREIDRDEFTTPKERPQTLPGVRKEDLAAVRKAIKAELRRREKRRTAGSGPTAKNQCELFDLVADDFITTKQVTYDPQCNDWMLSEENQHQWNAADGKLVFFPSEDADGRVAQDGQDVEFRDPKDGSIIYERGGVSGVSISKGRWRVDSDGVGEYVPSSGIIFIDDGQLLLGREGGGAIVFDVGRRTVQPLLGSAVTNPRKTLAVIQLSGQEKNADATEWFIHNYLPKATFSYQRIAAYGVGTRALADIAQGKADLFFAIRSGGGYDNAAAKTILEAAGCVVTDFDGSKWSVETSKGVLAAGNQTLFDIAHEKIAELQREGKKLPE